MNYFLRTFYCILFGTFIFYVIYFLGKNNIIPNSFPQSAKAEVGIIDSFALEASQSTQLNSTFIKDFSFFYLLSDSITTADTLVAVNNDSVVFTDSIVLERFFKSLFKLEKTKKGCVRVAYFGDSMIGGDLIVQDIRDSFQTKYGGTGVGFVGITSLSSSARISVNHKYSGWHTESFLTTMKPSTPFGIDGQVSSSENDCFVKYKSGYHGHVRSFPQSKLFYGSSISSDTLQIKVGDATTSRVIDGKLLLNVMNLSSKSHRNLEIKFPADSITPYYGVDFSDKDGFYIDNFSLRGNSGLPLSKLNTALMKSFNAEMDYDLIVLHYGANVLRSKITEYDWYSRGMTIVVRHLRECFPNADILVISSADKSDKIDGEMQSSPGILPLIEAQRNYAKKTQSGFINLYELMGGYNSMIDWHENKLSNADYTHFNYKGAKKIADLIYNEIDKEYKAYKQAQDVEE